MSGLDADEGSGWLSKGGSYTSTARRAGIQISDSVAWEGSRSVVVRLAGVQCKVQYKYR